MTHRPVRDLLGAERDVVRDVADAARHGDSGAELLADLPHRTAEFGLAVLELALRQRPVVVARPVDDRHLDLAVRLPTPDDTAGGTYVRGRCATGHGLPVAAGQSLHEQLLDVVAAIA